MADPRATGEVHGNAAKRFAEAQLEEVAVDVVAWTTTYRDPKDGSIWVMDYPHSEVHGGGSPRLRRQPD
ncbi:MAG: Imm27 family immunity protein [Gaiellaceae bacterium]